MKICRKPIHLWWMVVVLLVVMPGETPGAQIHAGRLHALLKQGIAEAMNLDMNRAFGSFREAADLDREQPTGYAFFSLAHLLAYEISYEEEQRRLHRESLLRYTEETMERGKKWLAKNPADGKANFAMTVALFAKTRLALKEKSYVTAVKDISRAWEYMQEVEKAYPKEYDVYLPMGMLHYHIDKLPSFSRFFSSFLVTSGDRERGLQEMERAAQKGDLLKELAQAQLSSIYVNDEREPAKALPYIVALKERFPRNYSIAFGLALAFSELRRYDEALAVAEEVKGHIAGGKPPYIPQIMPRYHHVMGRILFNQREYAGAIEYFTKALADESRFNAENRASSLLRLGMIYDIRKERKLAVAYYSKALEVEGIGGRAKRKADRYLESPYVPGEREKQ